MRSHSKLVIAAACSAAVVATLVVPSATGAAPVARPAPGPDAARAALADLRSDAGADLRVHTDATGYVDFVGSDDAIAAGSAGDPVGSARGHLARYGAALGLSRPGVSTALGSSLPTASGGHVVRFAQQLDGVPVVGGEVAVSVDSSGGLTSVQSSLTRRSAVPAGSVTESAAAASARTTLKGGADLAVTRLGKWFFDPAVFDMAGSYPARPVWMFEVGDGVGVREKVLVDAGSGRVLLHFSDIQTALDRVVCDHNNVRTPEDPCTSGYARTEGGPATGVADVDQAYDFAGATATLYKKIGKIDLTNLIGIGPASDRKLATTVRFCYPTGSCPYGNAFWNGKQMYFGDAFPTDDVMGHEMTHGVINRYSNLFYWTQSGAINESLADIIGEIVDHRRGSDSDANWDLAEDIAGVGPIRNMKNPPLFNQPDKMTSNLYRTDITFTDSGGVHTNSGVGNKAAYLISQGGTFNGVKVKGIDGSDAKLSKTARLYIDVIQRLTSGASYADLGRVLGQSCRDLKGTHGFTKANCTNVGKAVKAVEMSKQPLDPEAGVPKAAKASCPKKWKRDKVLFEGEKKPGAKFDAGVLWNRAPNEAAGIPRNAVSKGTSWLGWNPNPSAYGDPPESSLVFAKALTVPKKRKTFLWFHHWWSFSMVLSNPRQYPDGGSVLVDNVGNANLPEDTGALPWGNGPKQTIQWTAGATPLGFGGASTSWTASRLDLTSYAGKQVKPEFRVRGDNSGSVWGWFLDDVTVYTCKKK